MMDIFAKIKAFVFPDNSTRMRIAPNVKEEQEDKVSRWGAQRVGEGIWLANERRWATDEEVRQIDNVLPPLTGVSPFASDGNGGVDIQGTHQTKPVAKMPTRKVGGPAMKEFEVSVRDNNLVFRFRVEDGAWTTMEACEDGSGGFKIRSGLPEQNGFGNPKVAEAIRKQSRIAPDPEPDPEPAPDSRDAGETTGDIPIALPEATEEGETVGATEEEAGGDDPNSDTYDIDQEIAFLKSRRAELASSKKGTIFL